MTDLDRLVADTSSALRTALTTLSALAGKLLVGTVVVAAATYLTGLWVTDSSGWRLGGAVVCLVPVAAALLARWRLGKAAVLAPKAVDDLRTLFADNRARLGLGVVIDHDTGRVEQAANPSAGRGPTTIDLGRMRKELVERKEQLPALWDTVRAVTTVPGLAAIATTGLIGVGLLGTILLVVGLVT